jgi:long-subunit acyl-CoA synthetase (AMP-forming)
LTYRDFADRSRGLAYYLRKYGYKHAGILCPNTPAFLISIFGIAAAGAINTAANYQLNIDDIEYIFHHSNVDAIIVDREFVGLLVKYRKNHPIVELIVDEDKDKEGQFYDAVKEGWQYDEQTGGGGWDQLETRVSYDDSLIAVAYTSGTTAKPKGVEYTHRGVYLAAIGNAIES